LCLKLAFIDQCSNAICNGVLAGFGRVVAAYHKHFPDNQRDFAPLPGSSGKNQTIDVAIRSAPHKAYTAHFVLRLESAGLVTTIVLPFDGIATASFAHQTSRAVFDVAMPPDNASRRVWC
jgi:hypothetical protein